MKRSMVAGLLAGVLLAAVSVDARVLRIEVTAVESPVFDGLSFGDVGQYEMVYGRAYGEVDPNDRRNAVVTDIDLAPRNARGMVEYSTDVHILKPVDMRRGNGRILYDVVNRGNKGTLGFMNGVGGGNRPRIAAQAGTGFVMRQGYTVVWSGWESDQTLAPGNDRAVAALPVAVNPDGSPITGMGIEDILFNNTTTMTRNLIFQAANLDKSQASLTVRNSSSGPKSERVPVPAEAWSYVNDRQIRIDRSHPVFAGYDAGAAHEFIYPIVNPPVSGLGWAATRDVVSFLRHEASGANPVYTEGPGRIRYAISHGNSQSGRMLKGLVYWGFNEDEDGRKVFEGINPNISGAHAIAINDRFGDSGATARPYERHHIAKMEFPFTYEMLHDPISGQTDGLLRRCRVTDTCPKVMHTDGGNEAWIKAHSLVVTDSFGRDIKLPDNVRVFYFASTQHGPTNNPSLGICQQLDNPLPWAPHLKALVVALDDWATQGVKPPKSRHPRVKDGTFAPSLPQSGVGFPVIPGVTYNGLYNHVALLDKSSLPFVHMPGKPEYTVFVPATDEDGNDIAGLRTPDLEVPLATHTGLGLRRAPFAENEDCGLDGQYIPFKATKAERLAAGDPRRSIEERYPDHGKYVKAVEKAAKTLVKRRLLLQEDADRIVAAADARPIGGTKKNK